MGDIVKKTTVVKVKCDKCNGTGTIANNKCAKCNGKGKVDLLTD